MMMVILTKPEARDPMGDTDVGPLRQMYEDLYAINRRVNALEDHDIAGCNYNGHPFHHFSGNIWWANSKYLRKLEDIDNCSWWHRTQSMHPYMPDRMIDEFWICEKVEIVGNLSGPGPELQFPNHGLYSVPYYKKIYEGDV